MASSDRSRHIIYHPDSSERKCARSVAQLHKMAKDVRLALVSKKKLRFIDGTIPILDKNPDKEDEW